MKKKKKRATNTKKQAGKSRDRAELAIKSRFYLEASMIFSSILEKKLKKLLGKVETRSPGAGFTLAQSIHRVKYLHTGTKHPEFTAHFNVKLIDEIRNWKNQRNEILKDLPDIHVSQTRLERLATEGNRLVKEWNKAGKNFKSDKP